MKDSRTPFSGWPVMLLLAAALVSFAPAALAQVNVTTEVTGNAVPGGTVTVAATIEILDGSTLQSVAWTQTGGVNAALSGANTQTATVSLGPLGAYKAELFHVLAEPPVGPDDLPPSVPVPSGEFPGGLQNRFQVVGLNPFALEEAGLVSLEIEVQTSSGTFHGEAEIHTAIPWKVTTGLRNVPIGVPVLLQGKEQDMYDWSLATPGASNTALFDANTRNPEFTPDVSGMYQLQVTDEATGMPVTLQIYAGTWRGVVVGQNANGRPIADPSCKSCHRLDGPAPDVFTPWSQTGHAEIFTDLLNTNSHYSTSCFSCHMVGYDPTVANGGADDAPDFMDFLDAGLLSNPSDDNWTMVLDEFPQTARLANIQCENCHGPQNSQGHIRNDPRISLSSDVCASCHGEPLRHARFQQWQLSAHANYELAIDEGESGSCARCHTGNGFLKWLPVLLGEAPGDPTADITVTWTAEETHPQTCATCHDPHAIGTTSGDNSNARVRITGNTPMLIAGFQATNVGRGAICITCHNSRRGLHNDSVFGSIYRTSEASRAPHGSVQGDVVMGENAYFMPAGARGSHSFLDDTCVTCHMEATPPPDVLSYNQGGSNHTFFARDNICAECHDNLTAEGVRRVINATIQDLEGEIEEALIDLLAEQIAEGNTIDVGGRATITDVADIVSIAIGDSRGRQAFDFTLTNGTSTGLVGANSIDVVPPAGAPVELYDVASPNLVKAVWNYLLVEGDGSRGIHNFSFATGALLGARQALMTDGGAEPCANTNQTICLSRGRFQVEIDWRRPPQAPSFRPANVSNLRTDDSGLFFFDNANNLEFLVKLVNGCSVNDRFWVFFAGTTDVEFLLTVTDTEENVVKTYMNPMGQPANAVTDTSAFATCP